MDSKEGSFGVSGNRARFPRRSGLSLICLSLLLLSGCSATSPSREASTEEHSDAHRDTVALSSEKLEWLGEEIESWVESGELVGAELLIVKSGAIMFHEAFGWSHREDELPMQRNSIFPIKSMSKPITATAILMLVDDGKLSLDDPVDRYVPNFPHGDVRIRHLLSHTSGITYDFDTYDFTSSDASLEDLVTKWRHEEQGKTLGTHSYNDYNFAALAYIVGVVSERPVSTFFRERVFDPLGLPDTSTNHLDDLAWQARLNPWYRWSEQAGEYEFRRSSRAPDWPEFYAGGWGVFSTCMDYATFMEMWVNGGQKNGVQLLSEVGIREALTAQGDVSFYGHGWFLDDFQNAEGPSFWHGGGHDSVGIAFPADDALVVYLTQSRKGPHLAAFHNRLYLSGLFEHPGLGFRSENMVWRRRPMLRKRSRYRERRLATREPTKLKIRRMSSSFKRKMGTSTSAGANLDRGQTGSCTSVHSGAIGSPSADGTMEASLLSTRPTACGSSQTKGRWTQLNSWRTRRC